MRSWGGALARLRASVGRLAQPPARADAPPTRAEAPPANPAELPLPPPRLRAGGANFRADADFLATATKEARLVVAEAGSPLSLSILDLGCGAGRLAYGLIGIEAPIARYDGVDVMPPQIEWCAENVTPRHPEYRFRTIDVYNERYNPGGARAASDTALPFEAGSYDVAYAYSVFSHLLTADVRAYLAEFARLLVPGGLAMVTGFIEDGVPDEAVNPPGYLDAAWGGPLHCVRYARTHMERMARDAGLTVERFEHGQEANGQSRLILRRG
jgi:SAM-dependent methyltransferase